MVKHTNISKALNKSASTFFLDGSLTYFHGKFSQKTKDGRRNVHFYYIREQVGGGV